MKKILLLALLVGFINAFSQGYKISVQIKGAPKDSLCQLAYYFGEKKLLQDSARVLDSKGNFVFEGKEKLSKGIYLIVAPDGRYFDFVVNDATHFSMKTDTSDYVKNMTFEGSPENVLFYRYLNYITPISKQIGIKSEEYKKIKDSNPNKAEELLTELRAMDKQLVDYKKNFIVEHPETFAAVLFKSMEDVPIIDAPAGMPDSLVQNFKYQYFKKHYFDNIDFKDERMLRTPVFEGKVDYYLDKLVAQHWDSLIKESNYLLNEKVGKGNYGMFRYMLNHLTSKYGESKIMCMDEVPWYLYKNYYLVDSRVDWIDSTQRVKLEEEVAKKRYNLCGDVPPNIFFRDTLGNNFPLHSVKAEYTVVYFWSATCGHCKKATPKLWEYYKKVKDKGVEVYTICIDKDDKEYKKFINKYGFTWINTRDDDKKNMDMFASTHAYRTCYNVFSTPTIYILDKDKKIIGKKVDVDIVKKILNDKLGLPQEKEEAEEEKEDGHKH